MAFLLIVVVIFVGGSVYVWLRNRQPNNPLASVDDFEREMQALGTTPPAVTDGRFEPQPRRRMNTVSIRPADPNPTAVDPAADADVADPGAVDDAESDGIGDGSR